MSGIGLLACAVISVALVSPALGGERRKPPKELTTAYDRWLNEDVSGIISPEERAAFNRLSNDEEREQYIELFWLRRDPTPDTLENEFKEEHYRRLAYANERFASGVPGWRTDRGRIYVLHGPPDAIESHPSGGAYLPPPSEQRTLGVTGMVTFPFEIWRYRYLEDIGSDILFEFVDPTGTGEYRMSIDPTEKNALAHVPGGHIESPFGRTTDSRQFDLIDLQAKAFRPPKVKFPDLEALVSTRIRYNVLPMRVRTDFLRITSATVMAPVTVQFDNKDLEFRRDDGVPKAAVQLHMRVTSVSRRVVAVEEDTITVDGDSASSIYQKPLYLAPGVYRLSIVARDVYGGGTGTYETALRVPAFESDRLAASDLILADQLERTATRATASGLFALGAWKVRPRLTAGFRRSEKLGVYFRLYELGSNSGKLDGTLRYQVLHNGQPVLDFTEELAAIADASPQQASIAKQLSLDTLAPGAYTLQVTVTDRARPAALTREAAFNVY